MKAYFQATCVSIEVTDDCVHVGFADDEFDTRDYLLLERGLDDDEQDRALGMDTYHVERNDQRWSCYGGIHEFRLYRDRVKVGFTPKGAASMRNQSELEITFQLDADRFRAMKSGLEQVFAGTECLAVESDA